jgi:hypothetical protein
MQEANEKQPKNLDSTLIALAKYHLLKQHRKKLYGIKNYNPGKHAEALWERHQQAKRFIYSWSLNKTHALTLIQQYYQNSYKQCTDASLNKFFEFHRTKHRTELQIWEKNLTDTITQLNQNWIYYLSRLIKRIGRFIYRNTLIGAGSELAHWIALEIKREFFDNAHLDFISLHEAKKKPLPYDSLYRPIGGTLGAGIIYLSGIYSPLCMLTLALLSNHLQHHLLNYDELDDPTASVIKKGIAPSISLTTTYHLLQMALSATMIVYTQNYRPLAALFFALVMSRISNGLTRKMLFEANISTQDQDPLQQQRQIHTLFLASQTGFFLGQFFFQKSAQFYDILAQQKYVRATLSTALSDLAKQTNLTDFQINLPDFPFWAWFRNKDTIKTSWIDRQSRLCRKDCIITYSPNPWRFFFSNRLLSSGNTTCDKTIRNEKPTLPTLN